MTSRSYHKHVAAGRHGVDIMIADRLDGMTLQLLQHATILPAGLIPEFWRAADYAAIDGFGNVLDWS